MTSRAPWALLLAAVAAQAQGVVSARAGLVNFVQGMVLLNNEQVSRGGNLLQLHDGDSLESEAGRAEVLLGPGVIVRIAESSRLRLLDSSREETRIEEQAGTALVEVISLVPGTRLEFVLGDSVTEFRKPGLYRFESSMGELDVYRGEAVAQSGGKRVSAKRGDAIRLREQLTKKKFDPKKRTDTIHDWSAKRSFLLYNSDPEARGKQTNWTQVSLGWLWSDNYRRRFFSEQVAEETVRRMMSDAQQTGQFSDLRDRMKQQADVPVSPYPEGSDPDQF